MDSNLASQGQSVVPFPTCSVIGDRALLRGQRNWTAEAAGSFSSAGRGLHCGLSYRFCILSAKCGCNDDQKYEFQFQKQDKCVPVVLLAWAVAGEGL